MDEERLAQPRGRARRARSSVIATGGPADAERHYLDDVWSGAPVTRLDGRLDWGQLAGLLSKACVYIGPDTSVTHLAAAAGCPTVALYGPTDPRLWGPWPAGGSIELGGGGNVQNRGNVWLVQNPLPCMPCQLEGCERRLECVTAPVSMNCRRLKLSRRSIRPWRSRNGRAARPPGRSRRSARQRERQMMPSVRSWRRERSARR